MPTIAVDTPMVVRRDSLAGTVWAAGRVAGTLKDFSARGRAAAKGVVWNGNTIGAARAEYAWTGAPSATGNLVLAADLDTVRAGGFDLERIEARVAHGLERKGGRVQLLLRQEEGREYAAHADYRVHADHKEAHLDDLRLRFDTTTWASAGASTIKWGTRGIEVDNLDLRNGETGRVYVDGSIPRSQGQPASLRAVVTDFEIGDVISLAQSDVDMRGRLSFGGQFQGTLDDPRFSGAMGVVNPVYGGTALPHLRANFAYDGSRVEARAEALQNTRVIASAEGRVAIRLGAGTGPRLAKSTPIEGTIVADSLPLEALPKFTDLVSHVRGRAVGRIVLAGTVGEPRATGALALDLGGFRVVPTGMRMTQLQGRLRLTGDSIVIDTLGGYARGGPISLDGGVGLAELSKPSFDLRLTATNAQVMNSEQGNARVDIQASMYGPFERVYVNGLVRIREGVFYLPESDHKEVMSSGDDALFAVADTSVESTRELLPGESPFLKNLRLSLGLRVDRDTWVRSSEANVEIFSDDWLRISADRAREALVLDGVISTERGEYTFMSRRFQIRRGSATFIGTPELNPTVQATAEYEVPLPAREALLIRLLIGGTVRTPRLTLESNSQPPITQSDLLSYLAFGRSSSSLLQVGGSGLGSGGGGGGGLAGATGAMARNQIATIALGVAVSELERDAARSLQLDVFNITPADVPTELNAGGVGGFAGSTEIEAGRYFGRSRWFAATTARPLSFLGEATAPGLSLQYRTPRGWRAEAALQPRYLLRPPTLDRQDVPAISVLGLFLIKEWRF
jgi:translocation and assembly module TamB